MAKPKGFQPAKVDKAILQCLIEKPRKQGELSIAVNQKLAETSITFNYDRLIQANYPRPDNKNKGSVTSRYIRIRLKYLKKNMLITQLKQYGEYYALPSALSAPEVMLDFMTFEMVYDVLHGIKARENTTKMKKRVMKEFVNCLGMYVVYRLVAASDPNNKFLAAKDWRERDKKAVEWIKSCLPIEVFWNFRILFPWANESYTIGNFLSTQSQCQEYHDVLRSVNHNVYEILESSEKRFRDKVRQEQARLEKYIIEGKMEKVTDPNFSDVSFSAD